MAARRRNVLLALGALAGALAAPSLIRRALPADFAFEPLRRLPGFRTIEGRGVTLAGPVALLGLDRTTDAEAARMDRVRAAPCRAVFGPQSWPAGTVPIAVFSDFNCPNCPQTSAQIKALTDARDDLHVTLQEYPVLGPASEQAARLALAAGLQGQHGPAHHLLMQRALPPGPAGARRLAEALGLDAERLARDAQGNTVTEGLAQTRAVAGVFGVPGTPTLIVGRTRVVGAMRTRDLETLIALERETPGNPCG